MQINPNLYHQFKEVQYNYGPKRVQYADFELFKINIYN